MDERNPFSAIFKRMAEERERAKRAHEHASVFAEALKDEIAAAERVGACATCINNELLLMAARRMVAQQGELNAQIIANQLPGLADGIAAVIAWVAIDILAEQKMKAAMTAGGAL